MKKLVLDIDGVIADSTARFARATVNGEVNWEEALNSDYVYLDTPVYGSLDKIGGLVYVFDEIILLSSRYDHMKVATVAWLDSWGYAGCYDEIMLKPWEKRWEKTAVWKQQEVRKLLTKEVEYLLFVDDSDKNVDSVLDIGDKRLVACRSLDDIKLPEGQVEL